MTIGIDLSSLIYGRGVSRYTSNLTRSLLAHPGVSVAAYGSSFRQHKQLEIAIHRLESNIRFKHVVVQPYPPSMLSFMWRYNLNPIKKSLSSIDVFHSWDWLQPPDKHLPLVSTIHDLAILKFPESAHPRIMKMHQRSWQVLKDRQAEIIVPSLSTRKDVLELLQFPVNKVHVIYEALPQETVEISNQLSEEEAEIIKQKLQLTKPFLLFVGTREPRKNLLKLIEAWKPLKKDVQLVIAGEKGWDETSKLESNKDLRFLGRVTNKELAVLYGEAEAFVFPSLAEGFGLPILEAFYHGTPVVTSNVSSMIEVAGNAAELVDPFEVESIREGISNILSENKDQQQKRLQKMIVRRHLFSWDKVAIDTVSVYQKAINNNQ